MLSNYSKFVAGVTEVASVERDLQVLISPSSLQEAHDTTLHPLPVLQAVCCHALPMVSH